MRTQFPSIPQKLVMLLLFSCLFYGVLAWLPLSLRLVKAETLIPSAAPDLVIESITYNPPNPGAGKTADILVTVKNQGDATVTANFRVYLYAEPADNPPTQATPFTTFTTYGVGLAPGESFVWSRTGHSFTQNNPKVYAWVDPAWENKVVESNENNNLFPQTSAGDAFEEDDLCAQAKEVIVDGAEQLHDLTRAPGIDEDWMKFTAKNGVTYLIEAIAVGKDADLRLSFHSACDGPPSFGAGAALTFTAKADGIYYAMIESNNQNYGPETNYRFKVTSNSQCANSYESNDSCPNSNYLPLNQDQAQSFCKANDVDWVQFEVKAGVRYKLITTNIGTKANLQATLDDSCQEDEKTTQGEILEFTAPRAGVYYAKIQNRDPNAFGLGAEYKVRVDQVGAGDCSPDAFEQDDQLNQAQVIAVGTGNNLAAQTHNACPAGEEDWRKFEAIAAQTYTIETLNLAAESDTILCLFTAQNQKLVCNDNGGAGNGSRLVWTAPTSATYFLSVKDDSATVAGPATQYDLRVFQGGCSADAQEPDNAKEQARPLTTDGSAQPHTICPASDEDWVSFTAAANSAYTLETTDVGPEADTIIELYDSAGAKLGQNDDHAPGGSSQLVHTFAQAGTYYAKVRLYNPQSFGAGTEYSLRIRAGATPATPSPSPSPTTTPSPTATPQPSLLRTLIVVNRSRLVELHGEAEVAPLMNKLATLASREPVSATLVLLDSNSEVSAAYAAWPATSISVEKANAVTTVVRNVIQSYLQQFQGIEYVVLVGDDRALPFRRIVDTTDQYPEKTYRYSDENHPTGAAQRANYYLSDDYYVDAAPTTSNQRAVYLPDLAIGRLIETPAEMIGLIDAFLASPVTPIDNVLVSGYDFVQDGASAVCKDWRTDLGSDSKVNCSLIGDTWKAQELRALQTRSNAPFKVQLINGHAAHWGEGGPDNQSIFAHEIASSPVDLSGGLLYTPGCHAGLNLPPSNSNNPIDLAQAFAGKRSNYIGHTGYGWGSYEGLAWSEELVHLFTRNLLTNAQSSMGKALSKAKADYYQLHPSLDAFDEKILQTMIFYGLPMFQVRTGSALSNEDPFPDVSIVARLPLASLGNEELLTGTLTIPLSKALGKSDVFRLTNTAEGDYYSLGGYSQLANGEPVQPLYFKEITLPHAQARSLLVRSATFTTKENFHALIAQPYNEYSSNPLSSTLSAENSLAWYPPVVASLQTHGGKATVVSQVSQYQAESNSLRIYDTLNLEVYYSSSADQIAPKITLVDGLFRPETGRVEVKVDVRDNTGIKAVVVSYFSTSANSAQIQSIDLVFDTGAHKWLGSFAGFADTKFYVQAVDGAGNLSSATNKGEYYAPSFLHLNAVPSCSSATVRCAFLPLVRR